MSASASVNEQWQTPESHSYVEDLEDGNSNSVQDEHHVGATECSCPNAPQFLEAQYSVRGARGDCTVEDALSGIEKWHVETHEQYLENPHNSDFFGSRSRKFMRGSMGQHGMMHGLVPSSSRKKSLKAEDASVFRRRKRGSSKSKIKRESKFEEDQNEKSQGSNSAASSSFSQEHGWGMREKSDSALASDTNRKKVALYKAGKETGSTPFITSGEKTVELSVGVEEASAEDAYIQTSGTDINGTFALAQILASASSPPEPGTPISVRSVSISGQSVLSLSLLSGVESFTAADPRRPQPLQMKQEKQQPASSPGSMRKVMMRRKPSVARSVVEAAASPTQQSPSKEESKVEAKPSRQPPPPVPMQKAQMRRKPSVARSTTSEHAVAEFFTQQQEKTETGESQGADTNSTDEATAMLLQELDAEWVRQEAEMAAMLNADQEDGDALIMDPQLGSQDVSGVLNDENADHQHSQRHLSPTRQQWKVSSTASLTERRRRRGSKDSGASLKSSHHLNTVEEYLDEVLSNAERERRRKEHLQQEPTQLSGRLRESSSRLAQPKQRTSKDVGVQEAGTKSVAVVHKGVSQSFLRRQQDPQGRGVNAGGRAEGSRSGSGFRRRRRSSEAGGASSVSSRSQRRGTSSNSDISRGKPASGASLGTPTPVFVNLPCEEGSAENNNNMGGKSGKSEDRLPDETEVLIGGSRLTQNPADFVSLVSLELCRPAPGVPVERTPQSEQLPNTEQESEEVPRVEAAEEAAAGQLIEERVGIDYLQEGQVITPRKDVVISSQEGNDAHSNHNYHYVVRSGEDSSKYLLKQLAPADRSQTDSEENGPIVPIAPPSSFLILSSPHMTPHVLATATSAHTAVPQDEASMPDASDHMETQQQRRYPKPRDTTNMTEQELEDYYQELKQFLSPQERLMLQEEEGQPQEQQQPQKRKRQKKHESSNQDVKFAPSPPLPSTPHLSSDHNESASSTPSDKSNKHSMAVSVVLPASSSSSARHEKGVGTSRKPSVAVGSDTTIALSQRSAAVNTSRPLSAATSPKQQQQPPTQQQQHPSSAEGSARVASTKTKNNNIRGRTSHAKAKKADRDATASLLPQVLSTETNTLQVPSSGKPSLSSSRQATSTAASNRSISSKVPSISPSRMQPTEMPPIALQRPSRDDQFLPLIDQPSHRQSEGNASRSSRSKSSMRGVSEPLILCSPRRPTSLNHVSDNGTSDTQHEQRQREVLRRRQPTHSSAGGVGDGSLRHNEHLPENDEEEEEEESVARQVSMQSASTSPITQAEAIPTLELAPLTDAMQNSIEVYSPLRLGLMPGSGRSSARRSGDSNSSNTRSANNSINNTKRSGTRTARNAATSPVAFLPEGNRKRLKLVSEKKQGRTQNSDTASSPISQRHQQQKKKQRQRNLQSFAKKDTCTSPIAQPRAKPEQKLMLLSTSNAATLPIMSYEKDPSVSLLDLEPSTYHVSTGATELRTRTTYEDRASSAHADVRQHDKKGSVRHYRVQDESGKVFKSSGCSPITLSKPSSNPRQQGQQYTGSGVAKEMNYVYPIHTPSSQQQQQQQAHDPSYEAMGTARRTFDAFRQLLASASGGTVPAPPTGRKRAPLSGETRNGSKGVKQSSRAGCSTTAGAASPRKPLSMMDMVAIIPTLTEAEREAQLMEAGREIQRMMQLLRPDLVVTTSVSRGHPDQDTDMDTHTQASGVQSSQPDEQRSHSDKNALHYQQHNNSDDDDYSNYGDVPQEQQFQRKHNQSKSGHPHQSQSTHSSQPTEQFSYYAQQPQQQQQQQQQQGGVPIQALKQPQHASSAYSPQSSQGHYLYSAPQDEPVQGSHPQFLLEAALEPSQSASSQQQQPLYSAAPKPQALVFKPEQMHNGVYYPNAQPWQQQQQQEKRTNLQKHPSPSAVGITREETSLTFHQGARSPGMSLASAQQQQQQDSSLRNANVPFTSFSTTPSLSLGAGASHSLYSLQHSPPAQQREPYPHSTRSAQPRTSSVTSSANASMKDRKEPLDTAAQGTTSTSRVSVSPTASSGHLLDTYIALSHNVPVPEPPKTGPPPISATRRKSQSPSSGITGPYGREEGLKSHKGYGYVSPARPSSMEHALEGGPSGVHPSQQSASQRPSMVEALPSMQATPVAGPPASKKASSLYVSAGAQITSPEVPAATAEALSAASSRSMSPGQVFYPSPYNNNNPLVANPNGSSISHPLSEDVVLSMSPVPPSSPALVVHPSVHIESYVIAGDPRTQRDLVSVEKLEGLPSAGGDAPRNSAARLQKSMHRKRSSKTSRGSSVASSSSPAFAAAPRPQKRRFSSSPTRAASVKNKRGKKALGHVAVTAKAQTRSSVHLTPEALSADSFSSSSSGRQPQKTVSQSQRRISRPQQVPPQLSSQAVASSKHDREPEDPPAAAGMGNSHHLLVVSTLQDTYVGSSKDDAESPHDAALSASAQLKRKTGGGRAPIYPANLPKPENPAAYSYASLRAAPPGATPAAAVMATPPSPPGSESFPASTAGKRKAGSGRAPVYPTDLPKPEDPTAHSYGKSPFTSLSSVPGAGRAVSPVSYIGAHPLTSAEGSQGTKNAAKDFDAAANDTYQMIREGRLFNPIVAQPPSLTASPVSHNFDVSFHVGSAGGNVVGLLPADSFSMEKPEPKSLRNISVSFVFRSPDSPATSSDLAAHVPKPFTRFSDYFAIEKEEEEQKARLAAQGAAAAGGSDITHGHSAGHSCEESRSPVIRVRRTTLPFAAEDPAAAAAPIIPAVSGADGEAKEDIRGSYTVAALSFSGSTDPQSRQQPWHISSTRQLSLGGAATELKKRSMSEGSITVSGDYIWRRESWARQDNKYAKYHTLVENDALKHVLDHENVSKNLQLMQSTKRDDNDSRDTTL